MKAEIKTGDAIEQLKGLDAESVHTCVTSPPYWGLRDYGVVGQLGLEATPDEYVAHVVAVMSEVWRVLRDDGTLWLNLGDCYATSRPTPGRCDTGAMYANEQAPARKSSSLGRQPQCETCGRFKRNVSGEWLCDHKPKTYKPKDLVGIPWRVAFALQADGWYLRSDIIWHKPNPMPESVTDRPTKSHEYIFLLSKSEKYFYDSEAIKEDAAYDGRKDTVMKGSAKYESGFVPNQAPHTFHARGHERWQRDDEGRYLRNKRSVWTVNTSPFPGAHFATFPPELIKPCILAGTSEKGCCATCGAPYERVVHKEGQRAGRERNVGGRRDGLARPAQWDNGQNPTTTTTLGWRPSCKCEADITPCTVLDPFCGAGTTGLVAVQHRRNFIGIELNPEYVALAEPRIKRAMGIPCDVPRRIRQEIDTPLFNVPEWDADTFTTG